MGKYLLENIHAQFPTARLGIVVGSRGDMIRDLFAAYPWLEVIEANRYSPLVLLSLFKNFYGSDLVVTQYAGKPGGSFSLASKLAARLLAKNGGLIGFVDASRWNKLLYDKLLPLRPEEAVADRDRAALRAAGIPAAITFPTLECERKPSVMAKFGLEAKKFIIVHLFAGNARRGLHPDKKRELLTALAEKLPDTHVVISGGTSDLEEALRLSDGLPVKVIAGAASLQEMMYLIKHSRGVVCIDTGIAHITAQLGKPLVVLRTCLGRNWWLSEQYGSNAPITVFSCDTVCTVRHLNKAYPACINAIDIKEVSKKL